MDVKSPEVLTGSKLVDFTTKKPRKFYGISSEKWNLASKLSQKEYEESETIFSELETLGGDLDAKEKVLKRARLYLQISFRKEDPSSHVRKLRIFWEMPHGPKLLSLWFEWLVDGSKDGDLVKSIDEHLGSVLKMVENFMYEKKGDTWKLKVAEVENICSAKYGNEQLLQVFLVRELAKMWGNKPEKIIFVEGEDELKNMSNQPFIYAAKVNNPGEKDYEDAIIFSVRVGACLVFDDVSFSQGLAAIIQLRKFVIMIIIHWVFCQSYGTLKYVWKY